MNYARVILISGWTIALVLIFSAVEGYNLIVLPTIYQTQQARVKKAEADNADELRDAENRDTQAKAVQASEIARYAERTQAAIARLKQAQADIADSQKQIAAAEAVNAQLQKLADAKLAEAKAEYNKAQFADEREIAYQSARLQAAQTCAQMIEAAFQQGKNLVDPGEYYSAATDMRQTQLENGALVSGDTAHLPCQNDPPAPSQDDAQQPSPPAAAAPALVSSASQQPQNLPPAKHHGRVVAMDLNVRKTPDPNDPNNIVCTLKQNDVFGVTATTAGDWVQVAALVDGTVCTGFVNGRREFSHQID